MATVPMGGEGCERYKRSHWLSMNKTVIWVRCAVFEKVWGCPTGLLTIPLRISELYFQDSTCKPGARIANCAGCIPIQTILHSGIIILRNCGISQFFQFITRMAENSRFSAEGHSCLPRYWSRHSNVFDNFRGGIVLWMRSPLTRIPLCSKFVWTKLSAFSASPSNQMQTGFTD